MRTFTVVSSHFFFKMTTKEKKSAALNLFFSNIFSNNSHCIVQSYYKVFGGRW